MKIYEYFLSLFFQDEKQNNELRAKMAEQEEEKI